jgi:NitT/TauT family transport system substrate-binding protein
LRLRNLALLPAILTFALTTSTCAQAADRIRIMVGGVEKQIYLPAKLAEQLGYFKDEGLDVELLTEPAGVNAEDELLAGAVQGCVGFYDHTIDLQSKGKFVESIVQLSQAPGEVELIATKQLGAIKTPADWKGKTLGVTGLGSSTNFLTQYIAVKYGLKPGDVTSLPVGAGNTFIAALMQGKIDGGMTTEPTVSRLLKTGQAKVFIDMRTVAATKKVLGGTYPAASFYMQSAWVDSHRDTAQKLANAFVRTLHFIATHSAAEIADKMPADYWAGDKPMYVKALNDGKGMFTSDGRMPAGGPKTVLAVLAAFSRSVKGKAIDLSRTYTSEFVVAANKTAAK